MMIAVTGVSGFIGGQVALHLSRSGHDVLGIDLQPCSETVAAACMRFLQADYGGAEAHKMLLDHRPSVIMHLGATSLVGPSIKEPEPYWQNNVVHTKRLLDVWANAMPDTRLIFSSSSSVYGEPAKVPCVETDTPAPLSPYGQSKLMCEYMIRSYAQAYDLDAVMFRYFNVCGADPQGQHGQAPGGTHIIARVLESIRDLGEFRLNGNDYDTADGTCVRDHVHVADVARLHELACEDSFAPNVYNVGLGHGTSNRDIVDLAQEITGRKLNVTTGPRRAGDPSRLLAHTQRLRDQGWQPTLDLSDMIQHAWAWYNR
jgi:UDP-glucose-4-epimerase GalE